MKYQKYNLQTHTHTHTDLSEINKSKLMSKNAISKTSKNYTYLGTCWKFNEFCHLAKECKNITSNTNQSSHITQEETMTNTYRIVQSTSISQIRYPTTICPTKLPILTQQITGDNKLSQEAWNQLSKK